MIIITLKKRKKTSTQNNSYDIIPVNNTKKLDRIGSYNQSLNLLTINVEALITLLWLGANFSNIFRQIFNDGSGLLAKSKKIKIKY